MRQGVIDKISNIKNPVSKTVDLTMLKRIQAKEMIFYNILDGKRLEGIKQIPILFKGIQNFRELIRGIAITFMALLIPAFLYPELVKIYGLIKRLKPAGIFYQISAKRRLLFLSMKTMTGFLDTLHLLRC